VGLYQQPNDWTCGPFALKHALVAIGQLADEQSIARVAHPHWWAGTNEVKLARAARHFDCDLPLIHHTDEERAHAALVRHLDNHLPVILCVDEWEHWVTVVRHEQERFVILDSSDEPVLQVLSWTQLRNRWRYLESEDDDARPVPVYDLHPIKPRFRVQARALFSVERAYFLRRPENASLAKYWDLYLEDLLQVCRPRTSRSTNVLSMGEFLRRNQDLLVSRVVYWHGHVARERVVRVLRNFRFVAETYGLVVPVSTSRRALVDLSILLAFWAAASYGLGEMYDSEEESRRNRSLRRRTRPSKRPQ
jgi:hypothetical protein